MARAHKLASRLRFHDRGVTVATAIVDWRIVRAAGSGALRLLLELDAGVVSHGGRRIVFDGACVVLDAAGAAEPEVSVRGVSLSALERRVLGRCALRHAEDHAPDLCLVLREVNARRIPVPGLG